MQCSPPLTAVSPSSTTFKLKYPTAAEAVFSNIQSSLPSHTCTEWLVLSRRLPLNSPQLGFTVLGCTMVRHSHLCGCVHCVLGTQSFQKAFDAPHCLRVVAKGNPGISYLADSSATWQSPVAITMAFVPMSRHSHKLLGTTPEGNTTLTSCWGSLPLLGSKQSRSEIPPCSMLVGRWRERKADAGGSVRNELVVCPLPPAALHPTDGSFELCQETLSCTHLQEGPFQFPRRLFLRRG